MLYVCTCTPVKWDFGQMRLDGGYACEVGFWTDEIRWWVRLYQAQHHRNRNKATKTYIVAWKSCWL